MGVKFEPLSIELIEEGRLLADADRELANLQAAMVRFCRKHGEAAVKAKAKLTISVELVATNPKDGDFAIVTRLTASQPCRLAGVSAASADLKDADEGVLYVRRSGSSKAPPQQMVLTTEDGRRVDTATGEVLDE